MQNIIEKKEWTIQIVWGDLYPTSPSLYTIGFKYIGNRSPWRKIQKWTHVARILPRRISHVTLGLRGSRAWAKDLCFVLGQEPSHRACFHPIHLRLGVLIQKLESYQIDKMFTLGLRCTPCQINKHAEDDFDIWEGRPLNKFVKHLRVHEDPNRWARWWGGCGNQHYTKYDIWCMIVFSVVATLPCSTLIFNTLTISVRRYARRHVEIILLSFLI